MIKHLPLVNITLLIALQNNLIVLQNNRMPLQNNPIVLKNNKSCR